jgi:hypothetical protein
MFDEVHGDRIPQMQRNRKLFNQAIGLVSRRLGPSASSAGATEVLNELPEAGPSILTMNELYSLIHPKMSCKVLWVNETSHVVPVYGSEFEPPRFPSGKSQTMRERIDNHKGTSIEKLLGGMTKR